MRPIRPTLCWIGALLVVGCGARDSPVTEPPKPSTAPPPTSSTSPASEPNYAEVLGAVASGIEDLKGRYPQLAAFAVETHFDPERLVVGYGHKTHKATHRGGWTAAVPNPDPDGVWFHIDIHDPGSTAQIHTQPMVAPRYVGKRRVMFLILEGKDTTRIAGALDAIMKKHGIKSGHPPK